MAGACKCGHDYAAHKGRVRRCTNKRCMCEKFVYDQHGADQDAVVKWTHLLEDQ